MRTVAKLGAVILLATFASVVVIEAQKGKPAPVPTTYWTAQIVGVPDDFQTPTIMGGYDAGATGESVTFDPATNAAVSVGVMAPDDKNIWNGFQLVLKNPDPTVSRPLGGAPTGWIAFRNFAFDPYGQSFAWGPYTPDADRLGPVPNGSGDWDWPFRAVGGTVLPYAAPEYQARFINSGAHPRQYYTTVAVQVRYQGDSFLNMNVADSATVYPEVGFAIWAIRDCSEPNAREVGISMNAPPNPAVATMTRVDADHWRIDIKQPIKLIEYGMRIETVTVGRKTRSGCNSYPAGGWWTTPVTFSLIVGRHN